MSIEEVLQESAGLGLDLSERTFRYYSVMGLLPRPQKRPGAGDARVHYYSRDILERLRDIRNLQAEGYSLKQIKKQLEIAPASALAPRKSADSGGEALPLISSLKVLAIQAMTGEKIGSADAALLAGYARALGSLESKVVALDCTGEISLRARPWLVRALQRLSRVTAELARGNSAETTLDELGEAQRELSQIEQLLQGYAGLLQAELQGEEAALADDPG